MVILLVGNIGQSIQEENHATANPNLTVQPEEDGRDIQDNVNNHLRKMSEYKNWIKVPKSTASMELSLTGVLWTYTSIDEIVSCLRPGFDGHLSLDCQCKPDATGL